MPDAKPMANPNNARKLVPQRLSNHCPPRPGSTIIKAALVIRETHSIAATMGGRLSSGGPCTEHSLSRLSKRRTPLLKSVTQVLQSVTQVLPMLTLPQTQTRQWTKRRLVYSLPCHMSKDRRSRFHFFRKFDAVTPISFFSCLPLFCSDVR